MSGGTAGHHRGVLHRQSAERHQQRGVVDDDIPGRGLGQGFEQGRADDMREDHFGRAGAVAVPGCGVPAEHVEEPVHLALRVVEPSGAGPAVGAAIDRLVAVAVDGTAQLGSQQLDQLVPADLHELFGAASRAGPRAMLQPSAPYGGVGDAAAVTYRAGQVLQLRSRVGVTGERGHGRNVAAVYPSGEHAPVRCRRIDLHLQQSSAAT